jgi:hypothetical protein
VRLTLICLINQYPAINVHRKKQCKPKDACTNSEPYFNPILFL